MEFLRNFFRERFARVNEIDAIGDTEMDQTEIANIKGEGLIETVIGVAKELRNEEFHSNAARKVKEVREEHFGEIEKSAFLFRWGFFDDFLFHSDDDKAKAFERQI